MQLSVIAAGGLTLLSLVATAAPDDDLRALVNKLKANISDQKKLAQQSATKMASSEWPEFLQSGYRLSPLNAKLSPDAGKNIRIYQYSGTGKQRMYCLMTRALEPSDLGCYPNAVVADVLGGHIVVGKGKNGESYYSDRLEYLEYLLCPNKSGKPMFCTPSQGGYYVPRFNLTGYGTIGSGVYASRLDILDSIIRSHPVALAQLLLHIDEIAQYSRQLLREAAVDENSFRKYFFKGSLSKVKDDVYVDELLLHVNGKMKCRLYPEFACVSSGGTLPPFKNLTPKTLLHR